MRLIFKTSSVTPDFFYVFNLILSFSTCSESFEKICAWELLGANVLKRGGMFFVEFWSHLVTSLMLRARMCLTLLGHDRNVNLNFGLARDHVVHLETAGNLFTGRPDVKSHWSRTFLIRDGIHYSRKGIYSRKNISCRLTKGKIWTLWVSKLLVWRQKWVAHVRQLARRSWSPGRKVFV